MSWFGVYSGTFFGGLWGSLVEYASRAKRGYSYVLRVVSERSIKVTEGSTTVKTRGRQD